MVCTNFLCVFEQDGVHKADVSAHDSAGAKLLYHSIYCTVSFTQQNCKQASHHMNMKQNDGFACASCFSTCLLQLGDFGYFPSTPPPLLSLLIEFTFLYRQRSVILLKSKVAQSQVAPLPN